jgi:hypothetical protein
MHKLTPGPISYSRVSISYKNATYNTKKSENVKRALGNMFNESEQSDGIASRTMFYLSEKTRVLLLKDDMHMLNATQQIILSKRIHKLYLSFIEVNR